jgi:4-hydroxysphinganine ceramide fatty acyl 2-hydroxylase
MGMSWKERLIRFRSFWIFPILAAFLVWFTDARQPETRLRELLWLIPLGIAAWTLLEYGLHRFVFHSEIGNRTIAGLLNGSHLEHHAQPREVRHLLVHTSYGLVVSTLVYILLLATLRDSFRATGLLAGVWMGFLYYESVHYRVHLSNSPGALIGFQRRAHFHHHFRAPDVCFGVTTPLWDYVFGSKRQHD